MSEPLDLPSERIRARHAAQRGRRRGIIALGCGIVLLASGLTAATAAIAAGSNSDAAHSASSSTDQESSDSDQAATAEQADPGQADALSATSGSLVAGESVTITGSNLAGVTRVVFGTRDAQITATADDAVTVTVPASVDYTIGAVAVSLETDGQQVAQPTPLSYTYEARTGVDSQLNYALAHWNNYNTAEFGDYNSAGGDCMNFVSQTLLARGWAQRSDWSNNGSSSTETWRYVPTFNSWFTKHATEFGATKLTVDQRDQVKLGDLVMFDWNNNGVLDHIQVVSGIVHNADGSISIQMVGHNLDSNYRDLDNALTVEHPGAQAFFWSLPDA